jgi:hypothetical protein
MTSTDQPDGPNQSDDAESPRRRDLRNEAAYLPQTIDELAELYDRLVNAGETSGSARGIATWAALKATGRPDPTGPATRARYRRILAGLPAMAPPPERPERSLKVVAGEGKGTRRVRGSGKLASVVALAIAGTGLGGSVSTPTSARAGATPEQAVRVVQVQEGREVHRSVKSRRRRQRAA